MRKGKAGGAHGWEKRRGGWTGSPDEVEEWLQWDARAGKLGGEDSGGMGCVDE